MSIGGLIVAGTFAAWIGLDVWLAKTGRPTESMAIAAAGQRTTIFPFVIGLLLGHWFFNQRSIIHSAWGFGIPAMVSLGIWDIIWNAMGKPRVWYRYAPIWLVMGVITGALVWAQQDGGSPL
jgi:hypothetical protein